MASLSAIGGNVRLARYLNALVPMCPHVRSTTLLSLNSVLLLCFDEAVSDEQAQAGRGASARLVLCYASRERKVQRVGLEPAVAHYFGWLAVWHIDRPAGRPAGRQLSFSSCACFHTRYSMFVLVDAVVAPSSCPTPVSVHALAGLGATAYSSTSTPTAASPSMWTCAAREIERLD